MVNFLAAHFYEFEHIAQEAHHLAVGYLDGDLFVPIYDDILHFMSGKGNVVLGDDQRRVPYGPGVVVDVPHGVMHGFEVEEAGVMLSLQKGAPILGPDGRLDVHYRDERCFTAKATVG